jgi:hypothetical protein
MFRAAKRGIGRAPALNPNYALALNARGIFIPANRLTWAAWTRRGRSGGSSRKSTRNTLTLITSPACHSEIPLMRRNSPRGCAERVSPNNSSARKTGHFLPESYRAGRSGKENMRLAPTCCHS